MAAIIVGKVWELVLTPAKQTVLLALADHSDQQGGSIHPGVPLIAWKTGYSERQVQRIMRELETDGLLIEVEKVNGKPTLYRIDVDKGVKKAAFVPKPKPRKRGDKMTLQSDSGETHDGVTSHEKQDESGGDMPSPDLSSIRHKDEPKEKDHMPNGIGETDQTTDLLSKPEPPSTEQQKEPPKPPTHFEQLRSAIQEHFYDQSGRYDLVGSMASWLNGGKDTVIVAKEVRKVKPLDKPATVQQVKDFAAHWRGKNLSFFAEADKFVRAWLEWLRTQVPDFDTPAAESPKQSADNMPAVPAVGVFQWMKNQEKKAAQDGA